MKTTSRKFRLFQYADCCVQSRKVIDLMTAIRRGLVDTDSAGRVRRVSDDLCDLGSYTEVGHKRCNGATVSGYFA